MDHPLQSNVVAEDFILEEESLQIFRREAVPSVGQVSKSVCPCGFQHSGRSLALQKPNLMLIAESIRLSVQDFEGAGETGREGVEAEGFNFGSKF